MRIIRNISYMIIIRNVKWPLNANKQKRASES